MTALWSEQGRISLKKDIIKTKEIFIPIAEIIGIRKVRSELQNLVLKCLEPETYNRIKLDFDAKYAKKEKDFKERKSYENQIKNHNKKSQSQQKNILTLFHLCKDVGRR